MNVRCAVGLVVLSVSGTMLYCRSSAAPAAAPSDKPVESVAVRYARAQLRLAELNLEKAEASNQKVAGTLVGSLVSQLSDEVEFAKLQLKSASHPGGIDYVQASLQRAELALRLAEGRLKRAMQANQRTPGTVKPLDLERLRIGVEAAQLRLESGREMATATPMAKLQWQIEMLNEELASIKQRTYLLGQNRFQF